METRPLIGAILLQMQAIDDDQLAAALGYQRQFGYRLGQCLVDLNLCAESAVLRALSLQTGAATVRLAARDIAPQLTRILPAKLARRLRVVPIAIIPGRPRPTLTVATSNPNHLELVDTVEFVTGYKVAAVLAGDSDLDEAIDRLYPGRIERIGPGDGSHSDLAADLALWESLRLD